MRLIKCATWTLAVATLALLASDASAYQRYSGCRDCHGDFTGGMSTKGSDFPSNDKHAMHRSSSYMGADCALCHTSGDNRNPWIGSSDGTASNPGLGCVGCHGRLEDAGNDSISAGLGAGLRQHHVNAGVSECGVCHTDATPGFYVPVGEDVVPPYYGTADTKADDPCNPIAGPNINENWTIGDFIGLDNDGDMLYDQDDPDCVEVVNEPPAAEPNGPYFALVGEEVVVDATGSIDFDGTIVAYDWDFGDGSTGSGLTAGHVYAEAGVYTVTLKVTDDQGATDTATTSATIEAPVNEPPMAEPNGPYAAMVGEEVTVDAAGSIDIDGTIVSYDWDFGDGSTGSGLTAGHVYTAAGVYTVTLKVTDDQGATDTATTSATIEAPVNEPPTAEPNGPYSALIGEEIVVDATGSTDVDGTIVAYDWDFGDGSTGSGLTAGHVYVAAGVYTVTLTVTDDHGATDTATTTAAIDVPANMPPMAETNGPYSALVGEEVVVDATGSSDADGTIVAYDWDFGDGSTVSGMTAGHVYAAAGTYTLTLAVTDDQGAVGVAKTRVTIEEVPPPSVLDLDIMSVRVTKRVSLRRPKPIRILVVVKNEADVDDIGTANVVGIQNGLEVYNEMMPVSDAVGNGHSVFEFPSFTPSTAGDILWTVVLEDEDPDVDEAGATTSVVE